jgi:hypothetical protein
VHDLELSHAWELGAALGEASNEVLEQLVGLLGARCRSHEFSRRMYVPWKFPANVRTKLSSCGSS